MKKWGLFGWLGLILREVKSIPKGLTSPIINELKSTTKRENLPKHVFRILDKLLFKRYNVIYKKDRADVSLNFYVQPF